MHFVLSTLPQATAAHRAQDRASQDPQDYRGETAKMVSWGALERKVLSQCLLEIIIKDVPLIFFPAIQFCPDYNILLHLLHCTSSPSHHTGPPGLPGAAGADGEPGLMGPKGERGNAGADGSQGRRGYSGVPGEKGEQGDIGVPGGYGRDGKQTGCVCTFPSI